MTRLGVQEYFTCVGFCLAVVKNLLFGVDLLSYSDWPSGHGLPEGYIATFYEENIKPVHTELTLQQFSVGMRRITPLEYFTGGFSESRPVSKSFTDYYKPEVKESLKEYLTNWKPKTSKT